MNTFDNPVAQKVEHIIYNLHTTVEDRFEITRNALH